MRLKGLVYRAHHPRWAYSPASGQGAALYGGRFNAKGVEALYTSRRLETAWLEAQQSFPFKAQPMTLCTYRVDCDDMVDLTSPGERTRLGIGEADLACAWEDLAARGLAPPSWSLARRLAAQGVAGILVNSYAAGATIADINAVFWRWADTPPHQVKVVDDFGRLPKDDAASR